MRSKELAGDRGSLDVRCNTTEMEAVTTGSSDSEMHDSEKCTNSSDTTLYIQNGSQSANDEITADELKDKIQPTCTSRLGLGDVSSKRPSRTPPVVDEYGFLMNDTDTDYPKCHSYFRSAECEEMTEERWKKILEEEDQWQKFQTSAVKVRSYIQKGVPHTYRGRFWVKLLDVEMLAMKANFSYKANVVSVREQLVELGICEFQFADSLNVLGNLKDDLLTEDKENNSTSHFVNPSTLRQIFCDIERTYPNHEMFSSQCEGGQEGCASLFRILAVYARYNKEVGYCQGMSYIAGLLLMQMSEAEAFWCLVALFERPKYLQGFYDDSLGKMKNYAAVFKKLLTHRLPALTKHLRGMELQPLMFLTSWYMCLFVELPCWDTVLFIWDLFMLDGVSTVFRVALAVMEVFEPEIMNFRDLSSLLPELLHLPHHVCKYETLVPAILATHIEPWEVKSLLAVISEEEVIRQKRKRVLSGEETDCRDGIAKRPKMQSSGESSTSLFRRFINFVTRKSDDSPKPPKKSHTQRLLQRAHTARSSRRRHMQSVNTGLSSEEFGGTPHTPADESSIHSRAREEFTFKMFNTPVPVRKSQGRQLTLPLSTVNSPEIELESLSKTNVHDDSAT